jgi:hypothetical protein
MPLKSKEAPLDVSLGERVKEEQRSAFAGNRLHHFLCNN